jgi:hypothetical protein
MERKTSFYSILPSSVKSLYCEIFFTFLESLDINFLLVAVSLMTTFPGMLSYCIAQLIEGMTGTWSLTRFKRYFETIRHCISPWENSTNGLGLLFFYFNSPREASKLLRRIAYFSSLRLESLFTSLKYFSLTCWFVSYDLFISLILNCI